MAYFTKGKQVFLTLITKEWVLKLLLGGLLLILTIFFIKFNISQSAHNKQPLKNIHIEVSKDSDTEPYKNVLSYTFLNDKNEEVSHCETNWNNDNSKSHVFYSEEDKSYVEIVGEEVNIYVGKDLAKGMIDF